MFCNVHDGSHLPSLRIQLTSPRPGYEDGPSHALLPSPTANMTQNQLYSTLSKFSTWQIAKTRLRNFSLLGEGQFGSVYQAELRSLDGSPPTIVAIKQIKVHDPFILTHLAPRNPTFPPLTPPPLGRQQRGGYPGVREGDVNDDAAAPPQHCQADRTLYRHATLLHSHRVHGEGGFPDFSSNYTRGVFSLSSD